MFNEKYLTKCNEATRLKKMYMGNPCNSPYAKINNNRLKKRTKQTIKTSQSITNNVYQL